MDSIDSFIEGDNLCQAIKCTENILVSVVKKLNQGSTATGSNNSPCSPTEKKVRLIDK